MIACINLCHFFVSVQNVRTNTLVCGASTSVTVPIHRRSAIKPRVNVPVAVPRVMQEKGVF